MTEWIEKFYLQAEVYNFFNRIRTISGIKQLILEEIDAICKPIERLPNINYIVEDKIVRIGKTEIEFVSAFDDITTGDGRLVIFKRKLKELTRFEVNSGAEAKITMYEQGYALNEQNISFLVENLLEDAFE